VELPALPRQAPAAETIPDPAPEPQPKEEI
jgi:hypothetical protein